MPKAAIDTRNTILKIALQLFLKKGYKDVSYQDLIKETGLSKGAIYHHFKSKEELLVFVFKFLVEGIPKPTFVNIENTVKDKKSFRKVFIKAKAEQFDNFQKVLRTKSIKFNKLLFFLEAIGENQKLKKIVLDILKQETMFLKECFQALKKHNKIPKEKDPALLAENLFWVLQGAEMLMFFVQNNGKEKDFMKMYANTIDDFFKII